MNIKIDKNKKNLSLKEIFVFFRDLSFIIVFIFIFTRYIIWPSQIYGNSMDSNFYDDEYILVDRFSYWNFPIIGKIKEYKRGDVIIFDPKVTKYPRYLIKRIIGLPGEKIKIEDGKVYIKKKNSKDFEELKEKYLNVFNKNNTNVVGSKETVIFNIPENSYFVMGDNRLHSTDSRECFRNCKIYSKHFVKEDEILGKVFIDLGYFNFSNFKFEHPKTKKDTHPKFFNFAKDYNYQ